MDRVTPKGLIVPLITPFYHDAFDRRSLKKLMRSIERYVDGYAPCLSSGEGDKLTNDEWREIVTTVKSFTRKPVYAGIKRSDAGETITLACIARELGCAGIIVPTIGSSEEDILEHITKIHNATEIPMLIYNTEQHPITRVETVSSLAQLPRIIGVKDSSMNVAFFDDLCSALSGKIAIFQGMEHQLLSSPQADGFLISLLNTEPALCAKMFKRKTKRVGRKIEEIFWQQNLGGNWVPALKGILHARGIIYSAEEVHNQITPDNYS